ncbi:hypothetical protein H6P81_021197 [Aristolochia fimbriata]|uniref:Secreted protein n=1 Tax=Aristolochia fimbriata TaxID=158543 RepID=A0AAV7DRM4_ARIFI|nr:hypothetical protein H6P81_021197 [Aristolochia fimbriata]
MAGPPLPCWVAGLAPLVASVPETDALRYPARNLVSPTPLLVVPLPIAANSSLREERTGGVVGMWNGGRRKNSRSSQSTIIPSMRFGVACIGS